MLPTGPGVHLFEVVGCDSIASRASCNSLEKAKSVEAREHFQTENVKMHARQNNIISPPNPHTRTLPPKPEPPNQKPGTVLSTGGPDDSIPLPGPNPHQNHLRLYLRRRGTTKTAGSMHLVSTFTKKHWETSPG